MGLVAGNEIADYYESLKTDRWTFEETWQNIADHIVGRREFYEQRIIPGRQRMRTIYDTTGQQAGVMLAGALHSLLTNPATNWFDLVTRDPALRNDDDANFWLEDSRTRMMSGFRDPEANFDTQIAEFWGDISHFGTGAVFQESNRQGMLRYSARSVSELVIDENDHGIIDTIFRKFDMPARKFILRFGKGKSGKADRAIQNNHPEEKIAILHLVHPRGDPTAGGVPRLPMPWRSVVIDWDTKKTVEEGGYWTNPWVVARWSVDTGELYGRGPGWNALSDCRMLNQMSKTLIKAAQKAADPPLMVPDDGVLTQIMTAPGSLNVLRQDHFAATRDPIRPIPIAGQFNISVELIAQRQQAVNKAYFSQLLQLFDDPRMTATQVVELATQVQQLIAPMVGRLQTEGLAMLVERRFDTMLRSGQFLPPPESLTGANIEIRYESPITRAQKLADAKAVLEVWNDAAAIAAADPTVLDNLSADQSIRLISEARGAPRAVLRPAEEVQQLRLAREQQQQEDEALAKAQQLGGIAKDVAGALPPPQPQLEQGAPA